MPSRYKEINLFKTNPTKQKISKKKRKSLSQMSQGAEDSKEEPTFFTPCSQLIFVTGLPEIRQISGKELYRVGRHEGEGDRWGPSREGGIRKR
ncbi:hypothetical protein CEXT_579111 [Caerostris extrusa]|uniref:Uncharacterized protein n=1 Tax=Caerostris extrusa TaxID=172846 RepID=A0AAV4NP55_CAEEX|nr:hypothetical protein CEXT_579111 [Caerostris extrusa]